MNNYNTEWKWNLKQDGLTVAKGFADDKETAVSEASHYSNQYFDEDFTKMVLTVEKKEVKKLKEGHLYTTAGSKEIYCISKWDEGTPEEETIAEVFEQCAVPYDRIYEDTTFSDGDEVKSLDSFTDFISDKDLIDLGTKKQAGFEFRQIYGFGRNTNKVLVYMKGKKDE